MPAVGGSTSKFLLGHILVNGLNYIFVFLLYDFSVCSCLEANLNGVYRIQPNGNNFVGIVWEHWLGDYSLKSTQMMIRPKVMWDNGTDGNDTNPNSTPPDDP